MKKLKEHVERRLRDIGGRVATLMGLQLALAILSVNICCVLSVAQTDKICLDRVSVKSANPGNIVFDQKYDRANIGEASFSCDLFVSASIARNALEAFRYGVLYDDKKASRMRLRFPSESFSVNHLLPRNPKPLSSGTTKNG